MAHHPNWNSINGKFRRECVNHQTSNVSWLHLSALEMSNNFIFLRAMNLEKKYQSNLPVQLLLLMVRGQDMLFLVRLLNLDK